MPDLKLYMILLGCTPPGRFTEQHDIFFGIGESLAGLKPAIRSFWKEAPAIHIDAWREVNTVGGYRIAVQERPSAPTEKQQQLFFINLGGYRENEFEEFHYKLLAVAASSAAAIQTAKDTAFFRHAGFPGTAPHIDDKYGVDVDNIFNIGEILSSQYKDRYSLHITKTSEQSEDPLHLGYLKWDRI